MIVKSAAIVLGLAVSVSAQFSPIAGYLPRTDAEAFLLKDLIQKGLEDLIGDETCVSFDLAFDYYFNGPGQYYQTIPTYTNTTSDVLLEYTEFYGKDDFVQIWAEKAIQKKKTNFQRGNADFGAAFPRQTVGSGDCVGFEESLKKALSFTGNLVEIFQLCQKAIDAVKINGCKSQGRGCDTAIEAWDAATAIYVGSLEGPFGSNTPQGTYGKTPYSLADKRCRNFANCGPDRNGDTKDLTAFTNTKVLAYFQGGSLATWAGNYDLMERYLRLISNKVAVPLIQGLYRYSYRLSDEEFGPNTFSLLDKEVAEAGAFAFGALPKLWACSSKASKKVEEQTKIGGTIAGIQGVEYQTVRLAFECNYNCLGISCAEVGSLFDGSATAKPGAEACDDEENGSVNTQSRRKGLRKQRCKMFTGKPGIKGRDKLDFPGASYGFDDSGSPSQQASAQSKAVNLGTLGNL